MAEYFVYNGGLYSTDELKHYGVKGMKWGVRKAINRSGKDSRRMIKKLNRVNDRMEKNRALQNYLNTRIDISENHKLIGKLERLALTKNKELIGNRYAKAKEKVDAVLKEIDQRGITLKQIKERKTGWSSGYSYSFRSMWNGILYKLDSEKKGDDTYGM